MLEHKTSKKYCARYLYPKKKKKERDKEREYRVEGEGFRRSLSPLRTTDRSGRGIAAGKSGNQHENVYFRVYYDGWTGERGASLRRGECQSQANKTEQEGT